LTHPLWWASLMNEPKKWRSRARAALEGYFQKRSFPRLMLGLILLVTGLVGGTVSYGLLHAGVHPMWLRYPVAVLVAYAVMLALVRLWIEIEQHRFDPDDPALRDAIRHVEERDLVAEAETVEPEDAKSGVTASKKKSGFNLGDLGSLDGCGDLGGCGDVEGCVPLLLVGVVLGLVAVLAITLAGAPVLLAEIFLDAFLIGALYRRLRVPAKENWLATAVRKTWKSALITAVLLGLGGGALQYLAPGAHSIGQAVRLLWSRSR
jgi:hypothetical protein